MVTRQKLFYLLTLCCKSIFYFLCGLVVLTIGSLFVVITTKTELSLPLLTVAENDDFFVLTVANFLQLKLSQPLAVHGSIAGVLFLAYLYVFFELTMIFKALQGEKLFTKELEKHLKRLALVFITGGSVYVFVPMLTSGGTETKPILLLDQDIFLLIGLIAAGIITYLVALLVNKGAAIQQDQDLII